MSFAFRLLSKLVSNKKYVVAVYFESVVWFGCALINLFLNMVCFLGNNRT